MSTFANDIKDITDIGMIVDFLDDCLRLHFSSAFKIFHKLLQNRLLKLQDLILVGKIEEARKWCYTTMLDEIETQPPNSFVVSYKDLPYSLKDSVKESSPYSKFSYKVFLYENISPICLNISNAIKAIYTNSAYSRETLNFLIDEFLPDRAEDIKNYQNPHNIWEEAVKTYGKGNIDRVSFNSGPSLIHTVGVGLVPQGNENFVIPLTNKCPDACVPAKYGSLRNLTVLRIAQLEDRSTRQVFWNIVDLDTDENALKVEEITDNSGSTTSIYYINILGKLLLKTADNIIELPTVDELKKLC